METKIIFGLPVMIYFFLAGTAAGMYIVSAILRLLPDRDKYHKLSMTGMVLAFISVSIGTFFLLVDIGHPERFWRLFYLPGLNPVSAIAWGSILIPLFSLICLIDIYLLLKKKPAKALLHYFGIFVAFGLGSYTGFLIGVCKAYPLWHSAIMAPLFFISGCMSGLGVIILFSNLLNIFSPTERVSVWLRHALLYFILIDLFLLTDYYVLYMGYSEAREVALMVLIGQFALLFWVGEILLGVISPFVILVSPLKNSKIGQIMASLLTIGGVVVMRYIIVIGGQVLPTFKPFS